MSRRWGVDRALQLTTGAGYSWLMRWWQVLGSIALLAAVLPACSSDQPEAPEPALSGVTAIAAGDFYSCALLEDGTVSCWGWLPEYNAFDVHPGYALLARPDPHVADVISLSVGTSHTCAVLVDGSVQCWGEGLRSGKIDGVTNARAVAAAWEHNCALLAEGAVHCWGSGPVDLGIADGPPWGGVVQGVSGATTIAVGPLSGCALLSDGVVKCWGQTFYDGDTLPDKSAGGAWAVTGGVWAMTDSARAVKGLASSTAIATGVLFFCAVLADTSVACWGNINPVGDVEDDAKYSAVPAAVPGLSDATAIAAGREHLCALLTDGRIRCWGHNEAGQLGDGSTISSATPVLVKGIDSAIAITAGGKQTCALLADRTVRCWGYHSVSTPQGDYATPQVVRTAR